MRLGVRQTLLLLLLTTAVLVGCSRVAQPEGAGAGAVIGDTLIIGTMEGDLLALDVSTGATLWRRELLDRDNEANAAVYGMPAVDGDTIYVGGYNGRLYAISIEGEEIWTEPVGIEQAHIVGSPVIIDGVVDGEQTHLVLIGSSDGNVYGYKADRDDHPRIWRFETDGAVWSTPTVVDGVVYFGSLDHSFYAVNLEDGKEKWRFKTDGAITTTALVARGKVYFGSFDGNFYAVDIETSEEVARFEGASGWYWAAPVATEDTIYAPSLDGNLYALDLDTLEERWPPIETDRAITASPVIIGERIAIPSKDGRVRVVRLRDGGDLRQCNIGSKIKSLIKGEGMLFLGADDHSVRALGIDSRYDLDEEWARFTDSDEPEPQSRSKPC